MRHEVIQLAEGWTGTNQTVAKVRQIVIQSLTDPVVVQTAQNLVRNLPERDKDAEIEAISDFVRNRVRYTNEGIETLKTPRVMLDEIRQYGRAVGDCDDHVILWASLHRAVGSKVRYQVISQRRDQIANHIYAEVFSPTRGWITDELIVKNQPLGWVIPDAKVTKRVTYLGGFAMDRDDSLFGVGLTQEERQQRRQARWARRAARRMEWMARHRAIPLSDYLQMGEEEEESFVSEINRGDDGVGFLPLVAGAASAAGGLLKAFKKKKKKKGAAGPSGPSGEAGPSGPGTNTLLYVGGGIALLLVLMTVLKK